MSFKLICELMPFKKVGGLCISYLIEEKPALLEDAVFRCKELPEPIALKSES